MPAPHDEDRMRLSSKPELLEMCCWPSDMILKNKEQFKLIDQKILNNRKLLSTVFRLYMMPGVSGLQSTHHTSVSVYVCEWACVCV